MVILKNIIMYWNIILKFLVKAYSILLSYILNSSIYKYIIHSHLYGAYLKNITIINIILFIILIYVSYKYSKQQKIFNSLPISIYKSNKIIYESNATKLIEKNDNVYVINENDYKYLIYITDKDNLLYRLNEHISIMIYDSSGNILYISDLFKKDLYMIYSFENIKKFIHELVLNTASNIDISQINVFDLNQTINFQYKTDIFSLNFNKYDGLYIISYKHHDKSTDNSITYLINNIKEIYKNNHIIELNDEYRVRDSNTSLISINDTIEDVQNKYDKFSFVKYNIYKDQKIIVTYLQINELLSTFQTVISDNLLIILVTITNAFNNVKNQSNDSIISTNKIISANLLYIQNCLQQIILMEKSTVYTKFNIYEAINPLLNNLRLTFNNIINININQFYQLNVHFSTELIEYIITHAYILSYHYGINIQLNTEKTIKNLVISFIYEDTTKTFNGITYKDHIIRLEYILLINNIQCVVNNNCVKFSIKLV